MTTRFISLATAIVLLDVFLRSQLSSNDPLFLFASNNIGVNAGMLLVVAFMVFLSFGRKFKRWWSFTLCALAAVLFAFIGLMGTFFSEVFYNFPQILLQLDYMFLMEASVVFSICALTYAHPPLPYRLRLPKVALPSNFSFDLPVPKIPHSPGASRTVGTRNS
jgi:hypothetical protein